MINARIANTTPRSRLSYSNVVQSGGSSSGGNIAIGNPIGLLLALTYAEAHTGTTTSGSGAGGFSPTSRIT